MAEAEAKHEEQEAGTSVAERMNSEYRHRRQSSAESILAPLSPSTRPQLKVSPLVSDAPLQEPSRAATTEDHQKLHDLQALTSNYEMLLQHFSLRKSPTRRAATALPSVDKPHRRHARLSLTRLLHQCKHSMVSSVRSSSARLRDPFDPRESLTLAAWTCLLISVSVFQIFYLPFAPVYLRCAAATRSSMVAINMALELVFVVGIALTFHTAVAVEAIGYAQKEHASGFRIVRSHRAIAQLYIQRGSFWMDLFGSLPLETIAYVTRSRGSSSCLLQTNRALYFVGSSLRLMRLYNLPRLLRAPCLPRLRRLSKKCSSQVLILTICFRMFLLAVVVAHYGACGLRHITSRVQNGEGDVSVYLDDLLCVLTWLLGNGDWSHEDTSIGSYAVAILLLGIFLSLYIMTNVFLVVIESRLTTNCELERKLNALRAKMKKLDLPSELQNRIQQYYSYLWQEYDAFTGDLNAFARDLTRPLALEVGLCRYMGLVLRVPFWNDCSAAFISALVLSLTVRVHLADDYIVRKGEISTELVMIYRGTAEITTQDRKAAVPLSEGSLFGEVDLLVDCTRSTSVRAMAFMEICVLTRKQFEKRILKQYPHEAKSVVVRILRSGLETESYPVLWRLASQCVRAVDAELAADSDQMAPGDSANSTLGMTSSEAAEILVSNMHRWHVPLSKLPASRLLNSDGDCRSNSGAATKGRGIRQHTSRPRASSRASSISSVGKRLSFFFPQQKSAAVEEPVVPPSNPATDTIQQEEQAATQQQQQPVTEPMVDPVLELLQSLSASVQRMEQKLELLETKISQQTDDDDDDDVSGTEKRPNSSISDSQIALALASAQALVANRPIRDEIPFQGGRKKRSKSLTMPARASLVSRPSPVQSELHSHRRLMEIKSGLTLADQLWGTQ